MDASSERDEWHMAQVALGKREHLEPLVRRYASRLLTFIQRMIGNRHRSEELFQEVFLAVWQKRRQYKFPRSFKSWLYAIAVNRCRATFRRATIPAIVSLSNEETSWDPPAPDPPPSETVIATETVALVVKAVMRLPRRQREVVVLRVWEGLSYAEIAKVIHRSEATVRSHMHHALTGLREYLEPRLRNQE